MRESFFEPDCATAVINPDGHSQDERLLCSYCRRFIRRGELTLAASRP